ncbi:SusC/RagA family TonB-linked outer membrane protein [Flagellimonas sp.]|uniref:SusC/RagA family TonB-linked outer membrane protein n=1 Tax=Flagellimonas sp. TaxID=2058762 RepID=UPI003B51AA0E
MKKSKKLLVANQPFKKVGLTNRPQFKIIQMLVFTLCMCLGSTYALAEESLDAKVEPSMVQTQITGTVSDANGPLPGASVVVKGTSNGTQADFDGNYSLTIDGTDAVLVFSYIGYSAQEIPVGSQTVIDVVLLEDTSKLDEVVVIGYGTRTRGELTGAVSTLNSEEVTRTSNNDLAKSLSGKAAGLTVVDRGGYPGENQVNVLVRGTSTLGNNAPLVVIDGVPVTDVDGAAGGGGFAFLAPEDIESFSILKDAAAAIYGARAANGVIVITTKRGKVGKPTINISHSNQIQAFTRVPKFMNSFQYTTYQNEYDSRFNRPLIYSEEDIINFRDSNDRVTYPNTNWYDLTMKDWSTQYRTGVSVSGGTEAVKYFVNGDILDQGGLYKSNSLKFKNYQLRSNLDIKINDWIDLGVDMYTTSSKRIQPGVDRGFIYKHLTVTLPTEVGQYPNGLYGVAAEDGANPAVMSRLDSGFEDQRDSEIRTRLKLNFDLDWITEGLSFNANTTFRRLTTDTKDFTRPWTVYAFNPNTNEYVPQRGFDFNSGDFFAVEERFIKYNEEYLNFQLNYDRTFNDDHTFRAFVAMEKTDWSDRRFQAYKRDLISGELPSLFAGGDEGQRSTGFEVDRGRLNYFGSLGYNYKRKYLLDFTLRYDGSDNFPEGNRFGTFPGVQAAWVISEEPFLENSKAISFLKLRASWSELGNDRIPGFGFLNTFRFGGNLPGANHNYYIFGESPTQVNTFFNNNVANPNITWEKSMSQNVGLTFGLFDGQLTGDVNYYWGTRTDILTQRNASVPDFTALELPNENLGEVDNYGYEIELNFAKTVNENFSYNIGGNFSNAQNEVVFLDEAADTPEWRKREGKGIGSFLAYPTNGLYRNQAEVDADPAAADGTLPGDVRYVDTDGDGVISGNDIVRRDISNIPEITYAINAGLKYKNFDLNVLFQGQANVNVSIFYDNNGNRPAYLFEQRWTPDNPNARYPRAYQRADPFNAKNSPVSDTTTQDTWLHDASFLRLRDMQLGYNIPKSLVKFGDIRLFVRGSNIFTWDKLKDLDLDPEMAEYRNFEEGLYQPLKTWTLGVNVSL